MKLILALTLALWLALSIGQLLPNNGGTVQTMDNPKIIVDPTT